MNKQAHNVILSFLRQSSGMYRIANNNFDLADKSSAGPELLYHVENDTPLCQSVYRMGSDSHCRMMENARELSAQGSLKLAHEDDNFIVNKTSSGKRGIYQGKSVVLDSPKRNPSGEKKKFYVYVNSGRKDKEGNIVAKKVQWGDPNLEVRNFDDKARKSFLARHQCSTKTDRKTPGWWACNVHRYSKQLGLSSSKPW